MRKRSDGCGSAVGRVIDPAERRQRSEEEAMETAELLLLLSKGLSHIT